MSLPRLPLDVMLRGGWPMIDDDRIVGGTQASPNEFPYQISLRVKTPILLRLDSFQLQFYKTYSILLTLTQLESLSNDVKLFWPYSVWALTSAVVPFTTTILSSRLLIALTGKFEIVFLKVIYVQVI